MNEKVIEVVVVDGVRREGVETFRACGVQWMRYKERDGSNRYATDFEWTCWKNGTSTE